MMWRWRSTSNFTIYNVAHCKLKNYARKWYFPSAKSTRLIALVTMRTSAGQSRRGDVRSRRISRKRNEMCSASVLRRHTGMH